MNAVRNIDPVHTNTARNFGLSERELLPRPVPRLAPQLIAGLRITLGISWLLLSRPR